MIARARILLELDEAGDAASDRRVVAERVGVSESTVYLVAKRFCEVGGDVEAVPAKVTGDVEARVIALACTAPPAGFDRWSLRLLERQVVVTDGVPPLDHSTIGRVLKRGGFVLTDLKMRSAGSTGLQGHLVAEGL